MGFDNFEEQIESIIKKNSTMVKKLGQVNEFDIVVGSLASSSSSSLSSTSSDGGSSSSLESDSFEEVTSSPSSSSSSCDKLAHDDDPLSDMSSLIQQLPIKRGLSRHYQGKSQSFTSLANVRSLEDLAKQENPYNKKLKFSRSFGGGLDETHHAHSVVSIRHVPTIKKGIHSRASCSSLSARKGSANSFIPNRPPIPPHRSTSTTTIPNQPVLFA